MGQLWNQKDSLESSPEKHIYHFYFLRSNFEMCTLGLVMKRYLISGRPGDGAICVFPFIRATFAQKMPFHSGLLQISRTQEVSLCISTW
mmetsp:Transcript_19270/g.39855  ORF Transcript_19270/g.39855 Transcript_19270/m.39855 type:complete len:89 (+) Transcript_19270:1295-1561(+)